MVSFALCKGNDTAALLVSRTSVSKKFAKIFNFSKSFDRLFSPPGDGELEKQKNKKLRTTLNGGSLGSCVDEERS